MSQIKCSSANCIGIDTNEPISCYECKKSFHLSCLDIIETPKKIFVTKNIVFVCDACLEFGIRQSPKRKASLVQSTINVTGGEYLLRRAGSTSNLSEKKTKQSDSWKEMNEAVNSMLKEMSRNTSTLAELKNSVNEMNSTVQSNNAVVTSLDSTVKLVEQKTSTYASIVAKKSEPEPKANSNVKSSITTITNNATPSANVGLLGKKPDIQGARMLDAETKTAIKSRATTAGTNKISSHGLGSAVKPKTVPVRSPMPDKVELTKSIYLSRFETTVTAKNIIEYVKQQLPQVDFKHVSAHLLAAKDAKLEEYSYISFRLRCTDELFITLKSSDFWPEHVFIGDFIDRPNKRTLGDFMPNSTDDLLLGGDAATEATTATATDATASTSAQASKNGVPVPETDQLIDITGVTNLSIELTESEAV